MRYWYFRFEGKFTRKADEQGYAGLFSSALVPASSEKHAREFLEEELLDANIELIEIEDSFEFRLDDIDVDAEENESWLTWYEEVAGTTAISFTP